MVLQVALIVAWWSQRGRSLDGKLPEKVGVMAFRMSGLIWSLVPQKSGATGLPGLRYFVGRSIRMTIRGLP